MCKAWSLNRAEPQRIQHGIDMPANSATTLYRQAGWFIQGNEGSVPVKNLRPKLLHVIASDPCGLIFY
jgi:hypothetical protein